MKALMEPAKKKIIQKRVARRERFARMARLKYRKAKDVPIAKVQDLDLPPKYVPQNAVYEHQMGLMITESDGEVYSDVSLLNSSYISNSVTVVNDKNKLVCIKLHKNDHKDAPLDERVLQEWEKRNDPYWVQWARHLKELGKKHKNFIERNKDKFESNKLDEEAQQRYRDYCTQRDNILAKGACMEIRTRFDSKNTSCSELNINSGFVNKLNYEFEEFVQKVLMEGIPRFRSQKSSGLKKTPAVYTYENLFSSTFEIRFPETYFLGRNNNIKKCEYSLLLSGYFVKHAAEMSFITIINNSTSLNEHENLNRPIYRLYLEQQIVHENERKLFLENFYPEEIKQLTAKPTQICKIKEIVHNIESEDETIDNELSSDDGKISEELAVRDTNINEYSLSRSATSILYTDPLKPLMPHFQMLKGMYENKHQLMNMMLQQSAAGYLSKH